MSSQIKPMNLLVFVSLYMDRKKISPICTDLRWFGILSCSCFYSGNPTDFSLLSDVKCQRQQRTAALL